MDTFTAIYERRSIKHYDVSACMSEEEFRRLMAAVMLSPTSFNIQNWRFVRIVDADLRAQVCEAAWGQAQVKDAAELLVLCADLKAWENKPERYWRNADPETQKVILPMIDGFYRDKPETERDEAMRSCGIAAQTLMLAAKAMGYDTCPMIGFDADAVARLIKLPKHHVIGMMMAIGKAETPAHSRSGPLALDDVLVTDRFK
jgi:nitroreductase